MYKKQFLHFNWPGTRQLIPNKPRKVKLSVSLSFSLGSMPDFSLGIWNKKALVNFSDTTNCTYPRTRAMFYSLRKIYLFKLFKFHEKNYLITCTNSETVYQILSFVSHSKLLTCGGICQETLVIGFCSQRWVLWQHTSSYKNTRQQFRTSEMN